MGAKLSTHQLTLSLTNFTGHAIDAVSVPLFLKSSALRLRPTA